MAFFQSSSPARSVATTAARSTAKKVVQYSRQYRDASPEYEDEREGQDQSDMMVDDDGALSFFSSLTVSRESH